MPDVNDFNRAIIEEFRANGGKVGGPFEGSPVLLLTTTGAKSGQRRTTPVVYLPTASGWSSSPPRQGRPRTRPGTTTCSRTRPSTVEVGTDTLDATAVVTTRRGARGLFSRQAELHPQFADYAEEDDEADPGRRARAQALIRRQGGVPERYSCRPCRYVG